MAEQRTEEIGVRKTMRATVAGIVLLRSKDFLRLVAVAYVFAVSIAFFALDRWLDSFAYRVDLGPVAFLLAFAIAQVTVSVQTIRAARANPILALRYE